MNRQQMRKGLEDGVKPVVLVLKKWTDIRDSKGTDEGRDNCAFCNIYNIYAEAEEKLKLGYTKGCIDLKGRICPIQLTDPDRNEGCCEPYDRYDKMASCPVERLKAIEDMIALIRSLPQFKESTI